MTGIEAFLIVGAVWGAAGLLIQVLSSGLSIEERRKWHPRFSVGFGVLIVLGVVAISWLTKTEWSSPWLAAITFVVSSCGVALVLWLEVRFTKYCRSCGATVFDPENLRNYQSCYKCGAKLTE